MIPRRVSEEDIERVRRTLRTEMSLLWFEVDEEFAASANQGDPFNDAEGQQGSIVEITHCGLPVRYFIRVMRLKVVAEP